MSLPTSDHTAAALRGLWKGEGIPAREKTRQFDLSCSHYLHLSLQFIQEAARDTRVPWT